MVFLDLNSVVSKCADACRRRILESGDDMTIVLTESDGVAARLPHLDDAGAGLNRTDDATQTAGRQRVVHTALLIQRA